MDGRSHKFQVNLGGIIELLSRHIYSSPAVYMRELLQNGVDAIAARRLMEPNHSGEVQLELLAEDHGGSASSRNSPGGPTLMVADNGVGLTLEEIHRFLATIGQSSKRAEFWENRPADFIGRFGIGLLSGFMVSDEIVVITRSARPQPDGSDTPTLEWRGCADGTYAVRTLDRSVSPGTRVFLTAKPDAETRRLFRPEEIRRLARHYGGLLPFPIQWIRGQHTTTLNAEPPPWRSNVGTPVERRKRLLNYGRELFGIDFFDAIPLKTRIGGIEGVAYVLPVSPAPTAKRTHQVYLKGMLLSENVEGLLPDWAFFVKCVINSTDLTPTASRESFQEDATLAGARATLGEILRDYLVGLSSRHPDRLKRLVELHFLSIKGLAAQDDEFYRLFANWLPFETSLGEMSLGEYRREHGDLLRYVPRLEQFRQVAPIANAQGLCIINGAYTYDTALIEKFPKVFPGGRVELADAQTLVERFHDLSESESRESDILREVAQIALAPLSCGVDIRKFRPTELPALYSPDPEAELRRTAEQVQETASEVWGSVVGSVLGLGESNTHTARLCLNYDNRLVRKVAKLRDRALMTQAVEMLYVQSLLLGHRPLSSREMGLLTGGLVQLLERCADSAGAGNPRRGVKGQ